ncbi:hypothetical protein [Nocardiopsis deserti]|uniref:hypothetical protein n=1 Tax=Nocardiopsis deserti TaxID=2605988 RepID=UPI001239A017|nr:hypothetical protein [Nocardiopsis deserti]
MSNTARERAIRLVASRTTEQLVTLLDMTTPANVESRMIRAWICDELTRRYNVQAMGMTTPAIVQALEPLTGVGPRGRKADVVFIDAYLEVLTHRHPEAAAAEDKWYEDADDEAVFARGPIGYVLNAVRAL